MIKTRQVKLYKLLIAAHVESYTRCMKPTLWLKRTSLITQRVVHVAMTGLCRVQHALFLCIVAITSITSGKMILSL